MQLMIYKKIEQEQKLWILLKKLSINTCSSQ